MLVSARTAAFRYANVGTRLCLINQKFSALLNLRQNCDGHVSNFARRPTSSNASTGAKEYSEIPGPMSLPVVGSLPAMMLTGFDPSEVHRSWGGMFEKYGPIFKMTGLPSFVAFLNPDDLEILLKSTMHNPVRKGIHSLKKVRKEEPNNYFNNKFGLLVENGEEWRRVRGKAQGPFLKPKSVSAYLPQVDKATQLFLDRIDLLQKSTGKVPGNFLEEVYRWALECVGVIALNKELGCLAPNIASDSRPMKLVHTVNKLVEALQEAERNFHWWKFFKTKSYSDLEIAHADFLDVANESIDEALESLREAQARGSPNTKLNVLESLLQTEGLSRSDVATIILDMIMAGVDTASSTVCFTLYCLAKNQECQKKLQEEIDQVMKGSLELLPEHIASMPYLHRVLKESFRLFPLVLGIVRTVHKDIVLSGYKVPAGTTAMGFTFLSGSDEKYIKRAKEFIPERWGRDKPLGHIHPYLSLPFSTGTRMCLGKRIAEQEINIFLIRALQRYTVFLESEEKMKVTSKIILKPAIPLPFEFRPRE